MHCPFCAHEETKVIDSRLTGEGSQIRRRRECLDCGERFTTFETAELVLPYVVKRDNTRQPFDQGKLRAGITRAMEKRPVGSDEVEAAIKSSNQPAIERLYAELTKANWCTPLPNKLIDSLRQAISRRKTEDHRIADGMPVPHLKGSQFLRVDLLGGCPNDDHL